MLNITFCSFPDFSGNAKYLYDYMQKKYNKKMNFTWVIKDKKLCSKLQKKGINAVEDESIEMKKAMELTDAFFTTHANLTDYKRQNAKTLYVELWHGVSPKCMGFLIQDLSNDDNNWLNKIIKKIDYFIVPSKFWVPIFAARFNILPKKILPLGFPLFDGIIKAKGKDNLSQILNEDIDKYQKIIYYMPTARSGESRLEKVKVNLDNVFNIKKYQEKILTKYLEENNYLLCIKYHPSEKLNFKRINHSNIKYIEESCLKKYQLDTNAILNASDLLITDYSSLGLHYLMLEKPVIYLGTDLEDFNNTRGILFGNFQFWANHNLAVDIKTLLEKIEFNLNQKENQLLKDQKELLFGVAKDGGCAKICDFFFDDEANLKTNLEYTYILEEELKQKNEQLESELKTIKASKGYKILEKIRKIFH